MPAGRGRQIRLRRHRNAAPDGYHRLRQHAAADDSSRSSAPRIRRPAALRLLGNLIDDPCNFAVHAESESATSGPRRLRAPIERVTVSSSGIGSDDHLLMLLFERAAGETHVPFKGLGRRYRAAIAADHRRRDQHRQALRMHPRRHADAQHRPVQPGAHQPRARPADRTGAGKASSSSLRDLAAPKDPPPEIRDRLVGGRQRRRRPRVQALATKFFAPLLPLAGRFREVIRKRTSGSATLEEIPGREVGVSRNGGDQYEDESRVRVGRVGYCNDAGVLFAGCGACARPRHAQKVMREEMTNFTYAAPVEKSGRGESHVRAQGLGISEERPTCSRPNGKSARKADRSKRFGMGAPLYREGTKLDNGTKSRSPGSTSLRPTRTAIPVPATGRDTAGARVGQTVEPARAQEISAKAAAAERMRARITRRSACVS